ncbi:N-formylglutamate deformylase [Parahaliea maris]|uniref:N-formylglutamate deformylase n=1 Tax=Parahaliea maris TaxID=2716870 RepID=A0A5C8ZYY2_9GAMM|nr:N-formylglutamate deformylase [Parahaliea maris]TXS93019.1 N-formylglutamate deformylase [Parahaliea maris]
MSETAETWLEVSRGEAPMVLSLPHTGVEIPEDVAARLVSLPLARYDTDWWVQRLYGFAKALDITIVRTAISRCVIDVNRAPDGVSLYPGQATTGLCPVTAFDGTPLYTPGAEPDEEEIARRRSLYYDPYHATLKQELSRLQTQHPRVLLYDAHSIRSQVPRLFEGVLPDFNIGTNSGRSCAPEIVELLRRHIDREPYTCVQDGRFKGGWITRSFGVPETGVHAVQMELAQCCYMREAQGAETPDYDPAFAETVSGRLQAAFKGLLAWAA